jgi:hypothetical protein
MADQSTIIKRRIEAAVMGAQVNARNFGGDNATASADLMCAFVLLSIKSGADPDRALKIMWDNAKFVVADFWPNERAN